MSGQRPPRPLGLHHVALRVVDLAACERFYVDLMGMTVEWRPDPDNVYLTGGTDNLALHREDAISGDAQTGALDHVGFVLRRADHVDAWHAYLVARGVTIVAAPRTHRDGARSFYCLDPDGNRVQVIFHPPLVPADDSGGNTT